MNNNTYTDEKEDIIYDEYIDVMSMMYSTLLEYEYSHND